MIVLEGPDGGGKSTLARRLFRDTGLPLHPRACTSGGGPVPDLMAWTLRDVLSWSEQPLSIYDRHPLVSEYIYGPVVRRWLPPGFSHPSSRGVRRRFERDALLVLCLPALSVVQENVEREPQMAGVREHITTLWWSYVALLSNWRGWSVMYDYGAEEDYGSVLRAVRMHVSERSKG